MKGKSWITTEIKDLSQSYGYESTRALAARLGRSIDSVRVKAKRLGLRKHDPNPLPFNTRSITQTRMDTTILIKRYATQFDLPEWLIKAIIRVESGGNPWAIRYEPTFYRLYVADLQVYPIAPCSLMTEKNARATSWGLMQIMGQVARERGYQGTFLSSLCQPEIGLEWGCRQLVYLTARYKVSDSWEPVVRAYNGGNPRADNLDYVKKVMDAREYRRE